MFIAFVRDGRIGDLRKEIADHINSFSLQHPEVNVPIAGMLSGITGLLQGYPADSSVHLEVNMTGDISGMKSSLIVNVVSI